MHNRGSPIYVLAERGEVIEQRIRPEPERFAAVLGARPRARIVIEASTDSEWVARSLEALGHERPPCPCERVDALMMRARVSRRFDGWVTANVALAAVAGRAGDAVLPLRRRAVEMNPSVPSFRLWLAHAYRGAGQVTLADVELSTLRQLDPKAAAQIAVR